MKMGHLQDIAVLLRAQRKINPPTPPTHPRPIKRTNPLKENALLSSSTAQDDTYPS